MQSLSQSVDKLKLELDARQSETVQLKAGALTRSPLPFGSFVVGEQFTLTFRLEGATTVLFTLDYE